MLLDLGTDAVVVGHSERREVFGETDEMVARKTARALDAGLLPIVCIGETKEERDGGGVWEQVSGQIRGLLEELEGEGFAGEVRILYGGSVKPDNIADIMAQRDVDGGLVGGASL